MGNTLDMAKIKEDHQARTQRICDAARNFESPGSWPEVLALALMELAAIWREEANRLSELPSPKPRGWKTTMDSLRDCATRVSGVAVAMRNHGLPDSGADDGPKGSTGTTSSSPITSPITISASTDGVTIAQSAVSDNELQQDLRRVHDGHMTASQFREKHGPDKIPQDQMVEFLKNRNKFGPAAPATDGDDSGPKGESPQASTASASLTTSLSASSLSDSTPAIDADVTGTQATPALVVQGAPPDFPAVDIARQHKRIIDISGDPAGDFLRDVGRGPSKLVEMVHQESLAEAANAIIEQVREAKAAVPADLWDSDAAVKAGFSPGIGPVTVIYNDPLPGELVGKVEILNGFTIGAADAPPAWTNLPTVEVIELDAVPTLPSPGHTSVSQANLVSECALKWKLAKRHGAPERPGWALVGGKALHACIEVIEKGWGGPSWGSEGVALLWAESFERAIAQTEAENPLFPIDTWHASNKGKEDRARWDADGPEMVHRYLEWRAKWVADGWELLRTAAGVPVAELEFLAFLGGSPVKGFIDSAWYHKGRNMIAVIDWKSGTSKPADYFQQATYRHALEPLLEPNLLGKPRIWLGAFWDARSGELGPLVDLDMRHPKAEVELRLSMPRRIDAAGLYMPNVNTGYGGCGSCSLKRSCPVGSRIGTGEVNL